MINRKKPTATPQAVEHAEILRELARQSEVLQAAGNYSVRNAMTFRCDINGWVRGEPVENQPKEVRDILARAKEQKGVPQGAGVAIPERSGEADEKASKLAGLIKDIEDKKNKSLFAIDNKYKPELAKFDKYTEKEIEQNMNTIMETHHKIDSERSSVMAEYQQSMRAIKSEGSGIRKEEKWTDGALKQAAMNTVATQSGECNSFTALTLETLRGILPKGTPLMCVAYNDPQGLSIAHNFVLVNFQMKHDGSSQDNKVDRQELYNQRLTTLVVDPWMYALGNRTSQDNKGLGGNLGANKVVPLLVDCVGVYTKDSYPHSSYLNNLTVTYEGTAEGPDLTKTVELDMKIKILERKHVALVKAHEEAPSDKTALELTKLEGEKRKLMDEKMVLSNTSAKKLSI